MTTMPNIIDDLYYGEHQVRILIREGKPWFIASDVCKVLGVKNTSDSMERVPGQHKGIGSTDTLRGPQELLIVSEPGLYLLVFRSRKPAAERFTLWVAEKIAELREKGVIYMPGRAPDNAGSEVAPPPMFDLADLNAKTLMMDRVRRSCGRRTAHQFAISIGIIIPTDELSEETAIVDDEIRLFVRDCLTAGHGRMTASEIYASYIDWCSKTGRGARHPTFLGRSLCKLGFARRKSHGNIYYEGVAAKTQSAAAVQ